MKHQIKLDRDYYPKLPEICNWCRDNIGPGGYIIRDHCVWKIETAFGYSNFYFKHEKDAMHFTLKWL